MPRISVRIDLIGGNCPHSEASASQYLYFFFGRIICGTKQFDDSKHCENREMQNKLRSAGDAVEKHMDSCNYKHEILR